MKPFYCVLTLALVFGTTGCDRRQDPENIPTPQPRGEVKSPPTDPEQPTAPVEEGSQPSDKNTPADPKTGT